MIIRTKVLVSFLLMTAFACSLIIGLAPSPAIGVESATLQLATISPPDNIWYKAAKRFADAVAERTNGKVKIQIAHSGSTGSVRESVEALLIGTNDIVETPVVALAPYNSLAAIESYPFLIRDEDHYEKVYNGPVGKQLYKEIEKLTGFKMIGAGYRGPREVASKRPIKTVADLEGLKIRVPGMKIFRATWEMLGASPVPMSSKEVYMGLNQGIIDAVENPLEAHVRSKYYEAADYVIMTSHVYAGYTFIFNSQRFNSFSSELQNILTEEGVKAMKWGGIQARTSIDDFKAILKEKGVTFITPEIEGFREKLSALPDEFPELKPWVEKISNVR